MMRHKILPGLTALLCALSACTKDNTLAIQDEQNVKILFKTGTRAGTTLSGDNEDRYINTLRILVYKYPTGELAFNFPVYGLGGAPGTANEEYSGELEVKTGKYTFVFIANEHSDAGTSALLRGITTTANNTLQYLEKNVTFSRGAFDSSKDIPMVKVKDGIVIRGNNELSDPAFMSGANPAGMHIGTWPISMVRLGVRLDLSVCLTDDQKLLWQPEGGKYRLYVNNIPDAVSIFPGTPYLGTYRSDDSFYLEMTQAEMDAVSATAPHKWSRVIVPESIVSPVSEATNAVTVGFRDHLYNVRRAGYIGCAPPADYSLPRNTYRSVTLRLNITSLEFDIEVNPVEDWKDWNFDNLDVCRVLMPREIKK